MTFPTQGVQFPLDGHPQLVGEGERWSRCGHSHHFFSNGAPGVDNDWETYGLPIKTLWVQVDDVNTPTEVLGQWISVDDSTGAAVWVPLGGGGFTGDAGDVPFTPVGTIAATDTQAAVAEVASEAATALSTHAGAADPHTGYRLESADHSHASTGLQGGTVAHSALTGVTADQHHAQLHAASHQNGGADGFTMYSLSGVYFLRTNVARNLSNVGTEQALFNDPANGRLTLPLGTYEFHSIIWMTNMSATSGNFAFDPLGAGTAVCGGWMWHGIGIDSATPNNPAGQGGSFAITQQTGTNMISANTGTGVAARIAGMFVVTTAGTMIPSVTLTTAAAATVAVGTYFKTVRLSSSTSLVSLGAAD